MERENGTKHFKQELKQFKQLYLYRHKKVRKEQSNTVLLPQKNLLPKFSSGQKAAVPELHFSINKQNKLREDRKCN